MSQPHVWIYKEFKESTQSGSFGRSEWYMEFPVQSPQFQNPLTGWTGSYSARNHLVLSFPTRESALAFAEQNDFDYQILPTPIQVFRAKSYTDNFFGRLAKL